MTHHINEVSFGPHYPGRVNPLDGYQRTVKGPIFQSFKYFLKVLVLLLCFASTLCWGMVGRGRGCAARREPSRFARITEGRAQRSTHVPAAREPHASHLTFTAPQVVPTEYYNRFGHATETHQYSVSEYATTVAGDGSQAAAVDFMYDISPIIVTVNDSPPSLLHFLVRLCAVIGGVFAVTREYCLFRFVGYLGLLYRGT